MIRMRDMVTITPVMPAIFLNSSKEGSCNMKFHKANSVYVLAIDIDNIDVINLVISVS